MTGRIIRREACCLDSDVQQKLNTDLPVFLRPDWYGMFDRFVRQSEGNTVSLWLRDDAGSGGYLPL